jgi:hypothetical protein
MTKSETFWMLTLLRGALAVLIGTAILVVPDLARTLLLAPLAEGVAVLSLVVYGALDSALILASSFATPIRSIKPVLRLQSLAGAGLAALFCSVLFSRVQLHWFLYLIALQAVATSYAEHAIAAHTSRADGSRICYLGARLSLVAALVYGFIASVAFRSLTTREITLAAYAYLGAFGVAQILMAGRILYMQDRVGRLSHV